MNKGSVIPSGSIPGIPYPQLRPTLQTGDVMIFVGPSSSPIDFMIQIVEGAPYTHVGIVIRQGDALYFWDAPGGGTQFPDPFWNNQPHPGARAAALDDIMAYYMRGEVAVYCRHIQPAIGADQWAAFRTFIGVAETLPFPGEDLHLPDRMGLAVGMAASLTAGKELRMTFAGNFYCAHLAAESYMRMGLLPIAPMPANSYEPADFGLATPDRLPIVKGWSMSDIIEVQWDVTRTAAASRRFESDAG